MRIKREYLIYAILIFILMAASYPWFKQGVPVTDDYRHHASRMWFIQQQFDQGQYSEWDPYMYGGWPFLHFYHPLFYILSAPVAILANPIVALKIMTILAYAVALFGTFYGANLLFNNKETALIAAVAYSLSSHFLFHATVSGALPRLMALAILPLSVSLFMKGLHENSITRMILGGIGMAALLMMHTSVAAPAFIVCGICALYSSYREKDSKPFIKGISILILAVLISAAWVIPLFAEKEYSTFTEPDKLDVPHLGQSLRTFGIYFDGKDYIRSNYFGYSVMILSLIGLFFIRKNKTVNLFKAGAIASTLLYFNIFGILNYVPFMKTALSGNTTYFIGIAVFNFIMIAAVAAESLSKRFNYKYLIYIFVIIIAIDLYPGINAFSYQWADQPTANFVNSPKMIDAWNFIKNQPGDFVVLSAVGQAAEIYHEKQEFGFEWVGCPQCTQPFTNKIHNDLWNDLKNGKKNDDIFGYLGVKYYVVPCQSKLPNKLAYSNGEMCVFENERFRPIVDSDAKITNIQKTLNSISFSTNSNNATSVLVKMTYLKPHWHAYVDGDEVQIKTAWPEFMQIEIPQGNHEVLVKYTTNATHILAWLITIMTLSALIFKKKITKLLNKE